MGGISFHLSFNLQQPKRITNLISTSNAISCLVHNFKGFLFGSFQFCSIHFASLALSPFNSSEILVLQTLVSVSRLQVLPSIYWGSPDTQRKLSRESKQRRRLSKERKGWRCWQERIGLVFVDFYGNDTF